MKLMTTLVLGTALLLGAACDFSSSHPGEEEDCPIGSRGCPCTTGKGCDSQLSCVDSLCVQTGSGTGGTGAGGSSGAAGTVDLCKASTDAAFAACPIDEQYHQPILQDCEDRRAGQPAECLAAFDTALECESSSSAWSCNTDESGLVTASPSGCAAEIATHGDCLAAAAGTGGTGGNGSGGTGGTGQCIVSHAESRCSDCGADEYCEPGSSSSGIYCLPLCDTDADCCPPPHPSSSIIHCRPNTWVSSYVGNVCRTGS